jgi:uncharacterized membrane protein YjjP (DUF1212 family)
VNITAWRSRLSSRWASLRKETPTTLSEPDTYDRSDVAAMLGSIGIAMLEVGQPTNLVFARLMTIASRYTNARAQIAVLPTILIVQIGPVGHKALRVSTRAILELDKAGRIDDIVDRAAVGAISPAEAIAAVAAARKMPPRFGPVVSILGHILATIGFGLVVTPTWAALPGFALLGAVVGAALTLRRPLPALAPVLPTLAAMIVTVMATLFLPDTAHDGLLKVITPALVALLPGLSLNTGVMELAAGEVVAGASRLMYGLAQLMMLAFGVVLGVQLSGNVDLQEPSPPIGPLAVAMAVVAMAVGFYLFLSAPAGSLVWLVIAIGVAIVGQWLGGFVLARPLAGSVGAFAVVPVAMISSTFKTAPSGVVMILAAFWGLVPGAFSFIRVSEAATGAAAGFALGAEIIATIFSIALGTLLSWSMFRAFTMGVHRAPRPSRP